MGTVTREDVTNSKGEVLATNVEVETFDPVPFQPSEALQAAISAGHVTTSESVVEVPQKDDKGNYIKIWRQSYTTLTAKNKSGALSLPAVNGDESRIWEIASDFSNQKGSVGENKRGEKEVLGFQDIYVRLRNAAQGPEKVVEKILKSLKNLPDSVREAALVKLRESGLDV